MDPDKMLCVDRGEELDLIGSNYYKLPFCDEDVKQMKGLDWMNTYMNDVDGLLTPSSPSSHSSSCHSPSSSTSSTSNQAPLINDRPDTPLIAVKLEDFSNDCQFGDLSNDLSPDLSTWSSWPNVDDNFSQADENGLQNAKFVFDGDTAELTFDDEPPKMINISGKNKDSNSSSTLDKTLTSSILDSLDEDISPKNHLTVLVNDEDRKYEPMDYIPSSRHTQHNYLPVISTKGSTKIIRNNNSNSVFTIPSSGSHVNLVPGQPSLFHDDTKRPSMATSSGQKTQIQIPTSTLHTILKSGRLITKLQQEGQMLPRIKIKTEPGGNDQCVTICQQSIDVQLPPTPTSNPTSDSESSTHRYSAPPSPGVPKCSNPTATQLTAQMLTSPQRLSQTHGPLILTEEEKRTLVAEGYSVPARLPLTKGEEKALKKIRRKIKNKISAQESRRKKKEYVEALEKKMEVYNQENTDLRRKLDSLESSNKSLLSQLRSLQMLVAGKMPKSSRTVTTQTTSSCLMVLVLCFAIFLGGWYPKFSPTSPGMMAASQSSFLGNEIWNSRVLSPFLNYESKLCENRHHKMAQKSPTKDDIGEVKDVADETYESPKAGRIVMNDTGDSKMIRNTMEPQDAAAVIASRKVEVRSGKMDVGLDGMAQPDDEKKVVVIESPCAKE